MHAKQVLAIHAFALAPVFAAGLLYILQHPPAASETCCMARPIAQRGTPGPQTLIAASKHLRVTSTSSAAAGEASPGNKHSGMVITGRLLAGSPGALLIHNIRLTAHHVAHDE